MTEPPNSPSPPQIIDLGAGNTFQGPVAGSDQEVYNVSGERAQVVINPQGQVTQIGTVVNTTKVPPGLRILAVAVAVVLVTVLVVIGVVLNSTRQTGQDTLAVVKATLPPTDTPTITPTPLPTLTPTPTPAPIDRKRVV